jgi:hypothetical protein
MKKPGKQQKRVSAEAIARHADGGKDVSCFFTNNGRMVDLSQNLHQMLAPRKAPRALK